ncbi:head maturation protease, ClpP-related [Citreimonas sp.]|uniref:head maturation protease, ClpP-related n=1 Tax=Citreimonas sp. TaxID=3036715 RepID=UPI0040588CA2
MDDDGLMVGGELVLHGFVGDDFMDEGFTPKGVIRALAEARGDITVRLNSGGGFATDGAAIHSALKAYSGKVTMLIEGVAASAASLIAMAGDEIVMAQGAMLMIHDPSGLTMGPADAHRRTAGTLDKLAANYADVYASRSGQSPEDVRALMLAETWMTAEEAVQMGFADRKDGEAEDAAVAAFDFTIYAKAPSELRMVSEEKGWRFASARPRAAAPSTQEVIMTQKNPAAAPEKAVETPETPKQEAPQMRTETKPDPVAERRKAVLDFAGDKLTARQVEDIVMAAADPAEAKMKAADTVIEAQMKDAGPETKERAKITSDEGERNVDAMIGALGHTMFGSKLEGKAAEYRGLTMKSLAIELSDKRGFGFTDMERVKQGMMNRGVLMAGAAHSVSDFSYITAELMNRQLRAAYESRPGTWSQISRQRTATDFRQLYSVQAGVDTEMKKVLEDGEYQSTVLSDAGESFRVERYGRKVLLTFEAVINDDLGAFSRLPQDFARGALNLESKIAWGIINANANLSDGTALFATAAGRKNLASSGGAISATTVAAARKAMWEQRPLGAKAAGDDFISAVPDLLYVPPALEINALQFTAATTPETDGNTNPFKGTLSPMVEPRLGAAVTGGSDTAWYLFDSGLPVLEHAFLQGYEAPMVETIDRMDPDGVTMIARHIFGAGAVEFRGAYKNAGA